MANHVWIRNKTDPKVVDGTNRRSPCQSRFGSGALKKHGTRKSASGSARRARRPPAERHRAPSGPACGEASHTARNRVELTVLLEALAAGDRDIVPLVVDALNTKCAVSHGLKAARVAIGLQRSAT